MTPANQVEKTLGEQMVDLLRRKPKNFDVTFSVGPNKIEVNAVKFVLKAASPVFEREFEDHWENGVVTEDNGIPLPDLDPHAFQLFVNLLILDAWSLDSLKSLKLSPNNLLNLLGLCRRYEITKAIQNLEEAADDFIQSFDKYKDMDEFLEISQKNLETIFSFENIPLDETMIVKSAFRWADNQCKIKGLEPTGENYRKVLSASLFQIRFPTMSVKEFTKIGLLKKNVLKAEEKLAVYEYIGLDMDENKNWDTSQLPFKTNRRAAGKLNRRKNEKAQPLITINRSKVNTSSSSGCSVLSLRSKSELTTSPAFACDGSMNENRFQVNKNILLLGFGFLGPIHGDAHFDVTIQIKRCVEFNYRFASGMLKKNIFARKGKIFHFLLDEPIAVESCTFEDYWSNYYEIGFTLEGPKNIRQFHMDLTEPTSFQAAGARFYLNYEWSHENPLAELLFKKI